MAEISFSVEYAKTGRSSCKQSKEKIPKGDMRIAKITPSPFNEGEYMSSWYAVDPFFEMQYRMRKTSNKVESEDDLPGFDDLTPEDQDTLRQKIADFMNPDIKPPPKKRAAPKKAKAEDDEGGAAADGGSGSGSGSGSGAAEESESPKKKAKKEPKTFDSEVVAWYDAKARMIAADVYKKAKDAGIRIGEAQAAMPEVGGVLMSLKNTEEKTIDLGAVLTELAKRFGVDDNDTEVGNEANRALVNAFAEMSSHEFKNKDTFKALAYKKVAAALAKLSVPVTSGKKLASGKGKLEGVGKASGQKIDEFLETGQIAKLEEYRASS